MPIPGSNDDGTMIADLAQFELLNEIAEAEQQKRGLRVSILERASRSRMFGYF
jgi:hypothetical protein